MNREILFRGKRVDNGDWVYGYYLVKAEKHIIWSRGDIQSYQVTPETVDQFTGLTDKKRNNIFEGDIVKISVGHKSRLNTNWRVVFFGGAFCIYDDLTGEVPLSFIGMRDLCIKNLKESEIEKFIEITGNIHDNDQI